MNVAYDNFDTQDVSKIFGVTPQTVCAWARNGFIKAINVSDGTEKARYMFTDEEVTRVQELIKQHGSRKWMLYSKNQQVQSTSLGDVVIVKTEVVPDPKTDITPEPAEVPARQFNADKVMNKILKVQDLKDRLEDLEAERNQILKEIELLKQEIMEVI